ncbi:MAG: type I-E CRISPR-associated protein Cas5/CasD [Candidatus Lernaella stagnicola]|nr:type I-E CRISPR-associated protein Cas5/CasD [Candidatus Lernaella stagnicola]
MSTLLLRLAGPMQSWGTRSRFSTRDTEREPSKSGVIGLLCAALGRPRHEAIDDLATLRMGVRVDHEGTVCADFHTAGGGRWKGKPYGVAKASGAVPTEANYAKMTVLSTRYYLADADFVVGLEGDEALLASLEGALKNPVWPLYLGRKSHVPAAPIRPLMVDQPLEQALRQAPFKPRKKKNSSHDLRLVLECDPGEGEVRLDQPLHFAERSFAQRHVRHIFMPAPQQEE